MVLECRMKNELIYRHIMDMIKQYKETLEILYINIYTTVGGMSRVRPCRVSRDFTFSQVRFRNNNHLPVGSTVLGRWGADWYISLPPLDNSELIIFWEGHLSVQPLKGHFSVPLELKPELFNHIYTLWGGSTPGIILLGSTTGLLSTFEGGTSVFTVLEGQRIRWPLRRFADSLRGGALPKGPSVRLPIAGAWIAVASHGGWDMVSPSHCCLRWPTSSHCSCTDVK